MMYDGFYCAMKIIIMQESNKETIQCEFLRAGR